MIKKISNWPAVDAALADLGESTALPAYFHTAIADRLREVIEASGAADAVKAADILEKIFREVSVHAPADVRSVTRGEGAPEFEAVYALGKISFAQLLAARVADNRADTRFTAHVTDPRYLAYARALADAQLSVSALQAKTGERMETVSRKLAILRELGIVASRKQGNVVVNMLTPSARHVLEQTGLWEEAPLLAVDDAKESSAQKALASKRDALPDYLQTSPSFGREQDAKAA